MNESAENERRKLCLGSRLESKGRYVRREDAILRSNIFNILDSNIYGKIDRDLLL